jgi:mono/diheme cytochrome c family protein
MSMKRCFEPSAGPSLSAVSRALVVGGVLSLAVACARKDAANSDSTTAASNSATTSTTAMAPSATPVESVSTGETSVSADSQKNASAAGANGGTANGASGAATTSSTSSTGTKSSTTPTHHTVHHSESSTTTHAAASPAHTSSSSSSTKSTAGTPASTTSSTTPSSTASTASTGTTASADTGQKTAADTSKKTASAGGAVDHLLVSPQEYEGWKMFSVYCYRCHGVDAMGGGIAPNLRHSVSSEGSVTHDVFVTTVTNGRLDKGMPTWKALLSPEQIEDLWLYINARSSGRLAPGRPHMAQGANP